VIETIILSKFNTGSLPLRGIQPVLTFVRPSTNRRCKPTRRFRIFPHLSKVFSRDAWLAELLNPPQL